MLTQMPRFVGANRPSLPIALFDSQQVYAIEQDWFAQGYSSFALMQQAAWQMTQYIITLNPCCSSSINPKKPLTASKYQEVSRQPRACVWVGHGNNGGDGWLIAYYLQQAGWHVQVITVGINKNGDNVKDDDTSGDDASGFTSDALRAQRIALADHCVYQRFEDYCCSASEEAGKECDDFYCADDQRQLQADVYIDAIFGIGLTRAPTGVYKQAIKAVNHHAEQTGALVVAVDVPSGLVASTGQVYQRLAIQADVTLCLIARKFGLHTKDGMDYAGEVIDVPLIPYNSTTHETKPIATLLVDAQPFSPRRQNSYKGSYGHVLIIGGNRVDGSQGMGGAAILSTASAMATGAGKITVACHQAFHGALLTSMPDAMTLDLHDVEGVSQLIEEVSVIAIGMGLGRDTKSEKIFIRYLQAIMQHGKSIVIDADGLYHLAGLRKNNHELVAQLRDYSQKHLVCLTPHSGEAAMLLDKEVDSIESNRLLAIQQCADAYGGNWVLKGAGSLVLAQSNVYVSAVGNAGMASAGMGDVLSGVIAALLAQKDLSAEQRSLQQAVLIHGLAGDMLVNQQSNDVDNNTSSQRHLLVGQRGLQAQDMPAAIRHVMQLMTI